MNTINEVVNQENVREFEFAHERELIIGTFETILELESEEGIRRMTLPEIFGMILGNPSMLENYSRCFRDDPPKIVTSSTEVVGIYTRDSKSGKYSDSIMIFHGTLPKLSRPINPNETYKFSKEEFDYVLSPRYVPNEKGVKKFTEDEMLHEILQKKNTNIGSRSVILLPAEDILSNSSFYCHFDFSPEIAQLKRNTLFIGRMLHGPTNGLMTFLYRNPGFYQELPLIEPYVDLNFPNRKKGFSRRENRGNLVYKSRADLMNKYGYKLLPLSVTDGAITKREILPDEFVSAIMVSTKHSYR